MNFFAAQDNARRKTLYLALLFTLAVVTLIVLTNVLIGVLFFVTTPPDGQVNLVDQAAGISTERWIAISMGVIGVVSIAMLYKYLTLKSGGRGIAEALGGQLITHSTRDLKQRRLLNVVEEMAIAAGIPVPPVYLIPEPGINAFAAGFAPEDAVIGINQGTLDFLNREELQGVVAHEFSHILNGDMNINLRLIAILHGIVFLGMIGYLILRTGGGSRKDGMPLLALGLGLIVIGFGGTFFGNMIKAAVSRQREYLADSSAVQFTRHPKGIADALKKIGGVSYGSSMQRPEAKELSHMFFGAIGPAFLGALTATHPPLPKRIRAIDPSWDGEFPVLNAPIGYSAGESETTSSFAGRPVMGDQTAVPHLQAPGSAEVNVSADQLIDQIGTLTEAGLHNATTLLDGLDPPLREATSDPWSARALIYAMLLDDDAAIRAAQQRFIDAEADTGVPERVASLYDLLAPTDDLQKSTLVDLAIPTLKELSTQQYDRFMDNVIAVIRADRQIDLFEWVLHRILRKDLHSHFHGHRAPRVRYRNIDRLTDECTTLLSALANEASVGTDARQRAFQEGAATLQLNTRLDESADRNFTRLNLALEKLRELHPLAKPRLLKAAAACVLADQHVSAGEGALLHGIAATLDCPVPPSIYQFSGQPDG
ncbi:MAG: M48 family metallopeptidase [Proteobacteria bacterium]|nr:M48 family metallopeptidase [Pseudomonadota bacterium]